MRLMFTTTMLKRDYRFWTLAEEAARSSSYPGVRVGAVVGRRSKILSARANDPRTHPEAADYRTTTRHAEFEALRQSEGGDTIAVARLSKDGRPLDSRPCSICQARIVSSAIRWIVFREGDRLIKEPV
jgi:tRNA(Arg) A34 adenosine deaminase TadA